MIEYTYQPGLRWLIGGGLAAAAIILLSYLGAKGRSKPWLRVGLSALRWITMAAIVACLLDPEWVDAVKHQLKSRIAVLVDASKSMSIQDLPAARIAAAKQWVERSFVPSVPKSFDASIYAFDETLSPASSLAQVKAEGEATGIAEALEALLAVPNDEPLAGVVLCSDGIDNLGKDAEAVARMYRRKGIPIYTLTTGTTNDMHDIAVRNVQVRRAVPNQAPTKVTVSLRAPGYAGQSVPIQILHEDEMVAVKDAPLTEGEAKVELEFTPRQKGFQVYEVRIPPQPGEWLTSNNRRLFGLDVIDPRIRVLYMEGTPQQPNSPIPEWKYLKSALESDPNVKVKTLYREFGAKGKRLDVVDVDPETGEKIYSVEDRVHGFPRTLAALLEYDVIIHSDIRKESFTAEELRNMARLVEEYGGGFIMIGGNSAFGKGGYHRTILDRIIPVAMHTENDSQARPFHMQVPSAVWSHPVVALGGSRAETEEIWGRKFPLLYGCNLVDRAKPGAVVLGADPTSITAGGRRLILAVQNVGKGRSMAFTSDTTRTWGKDFETLWGERINPSLPLSEANCDSRYYRRFWVNAIRWLAASRIGRTNSAVTLELAQSYCSPKEKISLSVQVRDPALREVPGADVTLLISSGGKTNLQLKPKFDAAQHRYTAEVALPDPGRYVVTAVASARAAKLGDDRQLLVCEGADRELTDLRARPEWMANLARISGGKVLSSSARDGAPIQDVFENTPPVTVEYRRRPVWDKPLLLAAILGLLSVEWALRRLNGLA